MINRYITSFSALIIILCLILTGIHIKRTTHDEKAAQDTVISFIDLLARGDANSAFQHVWGNASLNQHRDEIARVFRQSQILDIIKIRRDSARGRPESYQKFDKIMSVMLNLKVTQHDQAGNPPGNYILFIMLTQDTPNSEWLITELGSGP